MYCSAIDFLCSGSLLALHNNLRRGPSRWTLPPSVCKTSLSVTTAKYMSILCTLVNLFVGLCLLSSYETVFVNINIYLICLSFFNRSYRGLPFFYSSGVNCFFLLYRLLLLFSSLSLSLNLFSLPSLFSFNVLDSLRPLFSGLSSLFALLPLFFSHSSLPLSLTD